MMMMMMVMMMWMVFGDEMGKKGAPHYPFALFFFVYSCNSFFFFLGMMQRYIDQKPFDLIRWTTNQ